MKWYTDYLSAYEKPYSELPPPLTNRVKKRIRELQHPNPLVSVVVIAHNEENRIFSCLWSICENNCHFPIEIIVINNHSTDNTESILKKLGVTYYNEEQKGPGFARQCGLNHAKGKYCVCIDSDTMYPPLYITTMTKALQQKGVMAAYALWSFLPDKHYSQTGLFFYEKLYSPAEYVHHEKGIVSLLCRMVVFHIVRGGETPSFVSLSLRAACFWIYGGNIIALVLLS